MKSPPPVSPLELILGFFIVSMVLFLIYLL
ncbi:hypothetical protein SAMN05421823_104436 [Catalinimonas alkaloidigena]|uniref:Uncharacterized protein n=1 Tax=Catalinimonas alkaloidigena TaxID=1075417 RepID=A0A1G9HHB5_9BACT|nr:hypothetical protein SAMN05421823_104436 [Catalinimonas alkaloidigena]